MGITVKTVSVNYERKVNLGNYESAAIGCTVWADVSDDQNLDEAMKALWTMAKENVKAQIVPIKKEQSGSTDAKDYFLGLPVEPAEGVSK